MSHASHMCVCVNTYIGFCALFEISKLKIEFQGAMLMSHIYNYISF